jgi:hypothetical protein
MEDGKLPVGFTFSIAQNEGALKYYGSLDKTVQNKITNYIQNVSTGDEAKQKIDESINGLANNNTNFLN